MVLWISFLVTTGHAHDIQTTDWRKEGWLVDKSTVAGTRPRLDQPHALPTHQSCPAAGFSHSATHTLQVVIHDHRLLPFNDVATDRRANLSLHQIPTLCACPVDAWPPRARMMLVDLHLDYPRTDLRHCIPIVSNGGNIRKSHKKKKKKPGHSFQVESYAGDHRAG